MEAIILHGGSKSSTRLLVELARKLNFKAKKLSSDEIEEMGLIISIHEGLDSGLLTDTEKETFLKNMRDE